nr:hypothetical protein [Candidatus Sigynarchaeota archaeon]
LEQAWELYTKTKKKLDEKDDELASLWQKMEESGVESVEVLKEENAKLKARVSELETARSQPAPPVTKPATKPVVKPAPVAVKLPPKPVAPPTLSELDAAFSSLPDLDTLPDLDSIKAPVQAGEKPSPAPLPDLDALPSLDKPVPDLPDLPDMEKEPPHVKVPPKPAPPAKPSAAEKPAPEKIPERSPAPSTHVPKPPGAKEGEKPKVQADGPAMAPVQKKEQAMEAQPVQAPSQAPVPVQGPEGVRIANIFNQPVADVADFIENGFSVIQSLVKDNHSSEEVGINLDLFRNRLKDIVGFSQSLFPMMTTARNLKKSKDLIQKQVLEELSNNLFRWKAEIIGHLK